MSRALLLLPVLWACGGELGETPEALLGSLAGAVTPAVTTEAEAGTPGDAAPPGTEEPARGPTGPRPSFRAPEAVRALYLTASTAGSPRRLEQLLTVARETEVNAFVIDVKDASGRVSHASRVPLARQVGAPVDPPIPDLSALLGRLAREGVYPIARIVIVQDPLLVEARPDLAVQDARGGVWVSGRGIRWLDPHQREVWDYHVDLAREAAELGFPEIQWDYVRFPDAPRSELARAVYPGARGEPKAEVIRAFLAYARARLGDLDVRSTADVFGVTATAGDVGIGQVWERFIDVVDVALPMIYPSHYYPGSFGLERPNAHPYEVVREAARYAVARTARVEGAGRVRPWLQDFTLGEPPYGPAEVRAQIQAVYDAGLEEWVLWNPSSRYTRDALEPVDGFPEEPLIRVAGRVVPVSQRFQALGEAETAEPTVKALAPSSYLSRAAFRHAGGSSLLRQVHAIGGSAEAGIVLSHPPGGGP